ncbi:hypothetical protein [Ekhidna sp.]
MRTLTVLQVIITLLIFSTGSLQAQVVNEAELFEVLKEKDRLLFSIGFNECNLEQMEKLVNDDFEFFHDKDGFIGSKKEFINTIKKNLCKNGKNVLNRELGNTSLEVFPLYNEKGLYGALQNGIHNFGSTQAKFSHLWLLDGKEWKLSRVVSYAHSQVTMVNTGLEFIELSDKNMKKFLGDYQFSPDFILSIVLEDGKLFGDAQGQKVEIKPTSNNEFATEDSSTIITFIANGNGVITSLVMKTPEGEMPAQKIDKG